MFFRVFINQNINRCIAIAETPRNLKKIEAAMSDASLTEVWDSARSEQEAFDYAEEYYSCYPKACNCCGNFTSVGLWSGTRWNEFHQKKMPYKGFLCDQCGTFSEDCLRPVVSRARRRTGPAPNRTATDRARKRVKEKPNRP